MGEKDKKNIVGSVHLTDKDIKELYRELLALKIARETEILEGRGNVKKSHY